VAPATFSRECGERHIGLGAELLGIVHHGPIIGVAQMNNLLNAIVMAALILTFAFAAELGPGTPNDVQRTAMSPPADAGPATAASHDPGRNTTTAD
jgi:hypothetical protein